MVYCNKSLDHTFFWFSKGKEAAVSVFDKQWSNVVVCQQWGVSEPYSHPLVGQPFQVWACLMMYVFVIMILNQVCMEWGHLCVGNSTA